MYLVVLCNSLFVPTCCSTDCGLPGLQNTLLQYTNCKIFISLYSVFVLLNFDSYTYFGLVVHSDCKEIDSMKYLNTNITMILFDRVHLHLIRKQQKHVLIIQSLFAIWIITNAHKKVVKSMF